ncbi:hypothetical protein LTR67_011061 [Exophiala xenobiotica]
MTRNTLLKALATFLCLSVSVVAAGDASNTVADGAIDQATVQKYKALFDREQHDDASRTSSDPATKTFDSSVFESPFRWTDIIHGAWALTTCDPSCAACPAGCNPVCCARRPLPGVPPPIPEPPSASTSRKPHPSGHPPPDRSPLSCPCRCGPDCPPNIQAVCCVAGEAKDDAAKSGSQQEPLDDVHQDIGFRPLVCPCHCEASCPTWIQAICCDTPGSDVAEGTSDEPRDDLGAVMQNAAGDPVSVLAAVNTTIDQSFITTDLVRGLERTSEIAYDKSRNIFRIVLDVIVGPEDQKTAIKQSFQVIDGSRLWEQEQVLLGLGFMARVDGVDIKKQYLTGLEKGLPILSGTKKTASQEDRHDEL